MVLHGEGELPEIIRTLRPPRSFASRLHGGQEERYKDADDGDHDEQLNQRKRAAGRREWRHTNGLMLKAMDAFGYGGRDKPAETPRMYAPNVAFGGRRYKSVSIT